MPWVRESPFFTELDSLGGGWRQQGPPRRCGTSKAGEQEPAGRMLRAPRTGGGRPPTPDLRVRSPVVRARAFRPLLEHAAPPTVASEAVGPHRPTRSCEAPDARRALGVAVKAYPSSVSVTVVRAVRSLADSTLLSY